VDAQRVAGRERLPYHGAPAAGIGPWHRHRAQVFGSRKPRVGEQTISHHPVTWLSQDRALLEEFRRGDRRALARVYHHYAADVAKFLRSGFMYSSDGQPQRFPGYRSPFELESAVQEVFTRAFSERARLAYDGLRPYAGFLYGIARNVALDELRKRARRGEVIVEVETAERAAGAIAVAAGGAALAAEEQAEQLDEERGQKLVEAFLTLECLDRDRMLYALRYEEELSQEQAAKRAGLTRIQLRRWETKFKKRLLRFLKRQDYVREP
jgi:RNA polymerase sigma factor (sigma-70 family)